MSDTISLDLGDLYRQVWGKPTEAFNPDLQPVSGDKMSYRVEDGSLGSAYYATDPKLGVEYFMPVLVTYPTESKTVTGLIGDAGGGTSSSGAAPAGGLTKWLLPLPLISMKAGKTIIETALTERGGTVKELINVKDYEITIRGFIISPTDDYPEADVAKMVELFEVNQAISIRSVLTDLFLLRPSRGGSDQAVIVDLTFPGLKGVPNVEPYELKLLSDEPFSLIDIS